MLMLPLGAVAMIGRWMVMYVLVGNFTVLVLVQVKSGIMVVIRWMIVRRLTRIVSWFSHLILARLPLLP
jgi:hypothetical protein